MKTDKRLRIAAFTLVELLVVIGIIAVLISILLPSLNKVRRQATLTQCLSNVKQITTACIMYANDNKGFLPRYTEYKGDGSNNPAVNWKWNWSGLIFNYVGKNWKVYECPGRRWKNDNSTRSGTFQPDVGGPKYGPVKIGYQVNGINLGGVTGPTYNKPFGPLYELIGTAWVDSEKTMRLSQISSDTVLVLDSVRGFDEQTAGQFNNNATEGYAGVRNVSISSHEFKWGNLSFADGHAESVTKNEFITNRPKYSFYDPANAAYDPVLNTSAASWQNSGSPGDLVWPNRTNIPAGVWTPFRGD